MRERRDIRGTEIRAVDIDGKPGVSLQIIRSGVVDDYGSLWKADSFDESLNERLPTLCWSHDWSEPLGPAIDWAPGDTGPTVRFAFSDLDAVPTARRAHAQCMDGTIRDCSVGFFDTKRRDPTDDEVKQYPGVREVIERARLDEVSLVLRGAVPGAQVLAVRTVKFRDGNVDLEAAVELGRKVAAGEMTPAEAKAALAVLADDPEIEQVADSDVAELLAEADALLEDI